MATTVRPVGVLLCLVSAAGFGALAVFGTLALDAGVPVATLLAVRFALAALAFGALAAVLRTARPAGATMRTALALGAVGYALQAGLFFLALERIDASLLTLLLYTYPAWVVLGGLALGRERASLRRAGALALAAGGLALALLGAGADGRFDALGAALGVGAALTYATYILVSERVVAATDPVALSGLVCAGAAATLTLVAAATGELRLDVGATAWLWLALIALVATVVPVVAFFGGLARVGAPTAAILSTFEPVVTIAAAAVVFGERLAPAQLAGAALIVAAAVLVAGRGARRRAARARSALAAPTAAR